MKNSLNLRHRIVTRLKSELERECVIIAEGKKDKLGKLVKENDI